jgi:Mg-chelatase subunit ChlD
MVLDKSGSMGFDGKMDALKDAAKRVIETASVADRIAIISFNDTASEISDNGLLYVANNESKTILKDMVDEMVPKGSTNFYDAFVTAFDVLDRSIQAEINVQCNTAILFFTDGIMDSDSESAKNDVIDLVIERLNKTSSNISEPIQLFTYSLSGGDSAIDEFPKELACATGTGVFAKIDYQEDIVSSLSSYYRLFALGLGSGPNEDFTAWVEVR